MDREAIRLECLRLRFRHDHAIADVLKDVKTLEEYVVGPEMDKPIHSESGHKHPKKREKSETPDIFS